MGSKRGGKKSSRGVQTLPDMGYKGGPFEMCYNRGRDIQGEGVKPGEIEPLRIEEKVWQNHLPYFRL